MNIHFLGEGKARKRRKPVVGKRIWISNLKNDCAGECGLYEKQN